MADNRDQIKGEIAYLLYTMGITPQAYAQVCSKIHFLLSHELKLDNMKAFLITLLYNIEYADFLASTKVEGVIKGEEDPAIQRMMAEALKKSRFDA